MLFWPGNPRLKLTLLYRMSTAKPRFCRRCRYHVGSKEALRNQHLLKGHICPYEDCFCELDEKWAGVGASGKNPLHTTLAVQSYLKNREVMRATFIRNEQFRMAQQSEQITLYEGLPEAEPRYEEYPPVRVAQREPQFISPLYEGIPLVEAIYGGASDQRISIASVTHGESSSTSLPRGAGVVTAALQGEVPNMKSILEGVKTLPGFTGGSKRKIHL